MSSTPSPYYKSKRHYEEIECHSKWVSEDLIKYYKGWNSDNPILISAQTGSGKNAFILNEIIPHAISIGGSVLLLSNRVALEHQQKIEVITKLKSLGYKFRDYSEEELKETYIFGPVTVLSYHSCISKLQLSQTECIIRQYKYIVFDEAHFFISDCLFNAYSYHVLQSIIKSSPTSVHIFMTATPEEVSDKIFETEANEYETKRTQHLVSKTLICGFNERLFDGKYLTVYKFPYDFSNYNIDFFYDYSEIIERVRDEDSEKWIVFVQRKADGQKIKKQIGTKNCRYLDSTRKVETNKAWTETRNGIISKKALVCTSVIDNGISIIEPQLKNIVISAIDRTEVFQMIGRKRLSQNETVNLYFYVPTPKEISQMINHTKTLLNIVNDYTEHPQEI